LQPTARVPTLCTRRQKGEKKERRKSEISFDQGEKEKSRVWLATGLNPVCISFTRVRETDLGAQEKEKRGLVFAVAREKKKRLAPMLEANGFC